MELPVQKETQATPDPRDLRAPKVLLDLKVRQVPTVPMVLTVATVWDSRAAATTPRRALSRLHLTMRSDSLPETSAGLTALTVRTELTGPLALKALRVPTVLTASPAPTVLRELTGTALRAVATTPPRGS